jgi:hypothetical protein
MADNSQLVGLSHQIEPVSTDTHTPAIISNNKEMTKKHSELIKTIRQSERIANENIRSSLKSDLQTFKRDDDEPLEMATANFSRKKEATLTPGNA